ncbi:MAG: PAS domain-containing protein [Suilimivivens sp.]
MEDLSNKMSFEEIEHVIDILNPCVDNYLFVLNLKNRHYVISENAVDRFPLPAADFPDYTAAFTKVVYEEDLELLSKDLTEIVSGKKSFHNLRYRWKDKEGKPVWINCRGNVLVDEEGRPELITGCINEIGKKQQADNVSGLLGETSLRAELSELIKNDKGVFPAYRY